MDKKATRRDRQLISADMNKVASELRHVEDFLGECKDYSKMSAQDRKSVARDLNKLADDMAYIENGAKDLGIYNEIVSYVREASKGDEKGARERISSDLHDVADDLEIAEKRLARNRITRKEYDRVADNVSDRLNKIADFAEEQGIEIKDAAEEKGSSSSYRPLT